jgi:hypothetical protein
MAAIAQDLVPQMSGSGDGAFTLFLLTVFLSQWGANWLAGQRPAR